MSIKTSVHAVWTWLGEQKNQQILMFVGGAVVATFAALTQFGLFEVKPSVVVNKPTATPPPVVATPAPISAPVTVSKDDQLLLETMARKEKSDRLEREYRQELDAWESALHLETIAGYQAYLSDYPKGRHARFALAAIDKLRSPILLAESSVPAASSVVAAPTKHQKPRPHKAVGKPAIAPATGEARIIVQCMEGTKLYVDGVERGRITNNLFGSFTVKLATGKHALLLVSSQGVLQQNIELQVGQSLRINPPFCGNNSSSDLEPKQYKLILVIFPPPSRGEGGG